MIFSDYKDKLFFIDIFLHLEFSFIIFSILFHLTFREREKERIDKLIKNVLKTNIFDGLSNNTNTDIENLKILKEVYNNQDNVDKSLYYLKKTSWSTIILISFLVVIVLLHVRNEPNIYTLVFDKILTFASIAFALVLQEKFINSHYQEIFEKDIYDMINKNIKELKSTTNY